jgi:hypothetical protein
VGRGLNYYFIMLDSHIEKSVALLEALDAFSNKTFWTVNKEQLLY